MTNIFLRNKIAMAYTLLISGGRDFDDVDFMVEKLGRIHDAYTVTKVITGGAKGVDEIGGLWADELDIELEEYKPDWDTHGKKAGMLRNGDMLDSAKPDGVICFPGGRGTDDMFRRAAKEAKKRCLDVWRIEKVLFRKEDPVHFFLSNFATDFDFVDPETGEWWMTSEHYYQACKTPVESERGEVQAAVSPFEAKKIGQNVNIFRDWDTRKIEAMRQAMRLKFCTGCKATEMLLDTGWDYLVEYAPWGDIFWGVDRNLQGENWLGKLLMERRDELEK